MSQINNSNSPTPDEEKVETAKKIASKNNTRGQYESMEENVFKLFRWISSLIDRIFFSQKYLGIFALVLACLSYFVATYDSSSKSNICLS